MPAVGRVGYVRQGGSSCTDLSDRCRTKANVVCIQVHVSEWRGGDIDANGDIIFAVGDVHGCASLLSALLDACAHLHDHQVRPGRLVFLGDVISRGPSTIEALQRWAEEQPIPGIE